MIYIGLHTPQRRTFHCEGRMMNDSQPFTQVVTYYSAIQ